MRHVRGFLSSPGQHCGQPLILVRKGTAMRDLLAFGHNDRLHCPSPLLRTMVGGVLRRTRLEQGRTLRDVARSAKISMQYLSELERGRKEASSEILAALCAALRLDLAELLAAVGRDLFDRRTLLSPVIRLDVLRDVGGVRADGPVLGAPAPASAGLVADGVLTERPTAPSPSSGNAVCRLAA
jgi:transcriptional regulator with XRE-family HTH domain